MSTLSPETINALAASFANDRKTATANLNALALHCAVHNLKCKAIQRQIDKFCEMLSLAASFGPVAAADDVKTI